MKTVDFSETIAATDLKFGRSRHLIEYHTCDTFLNPNREIQNFWSGNLCLVSGGFHVANFGLF